MRLHQVPIATFLSERRRAISRRVEGLAAEHFRPDAEEETVRALTEEFAVEAPRLTDAPREAEVEEVEYGAEQFGRCVLRTYEVWRIHVPFDGEPKLLEVSPTRCEGMAWPVSIEGKRLVVEIKAKDETPEQIDQWCEDTLGSVRENLSQLEREFADFNASLRSIISELIASRRAELEAREHRLANLGARWVGPPAEEPAASPDLRTADDNAAEGRPPGDLSHVPSVDGQKPPADSPLRVFISSTFEDLEAHRRAVIDALTQMGADVRGMENFGAQPSPVKEVCLQQVRDSQVYVGLFGTRYGTIDRETDKSFTELEYREATRLGLDRRIYFPHPDLAIPARYVEDDAGKTQALNKLKAELRDAHTADYFKEPEHLAERVCLALFPDLDPPIKSRTAAERPTPVRQAEVSEARRGWYFIERLGHRSPRMFVACELRFVNQGTADTSIVQTEMRASIDGNAPVACKIAAPIGEVRRENPDGQGPVSLTTRVPVRGTPIERDDDVVPVPVSQPVDRFLFGVVETEVAPDVESVSLIVQSTDRDGHTSTAQTGTMCRHR